MSCGCTDTTPCGTPDCGCKFEVEAGCVRYTGESLGATDIVEGDTLDTILKTLNTKFEEYGPGDYIELEDEAAGTNCTYGGVKIILRDGDDNSIKSTKYVCGVNATATLDGSGTASTIAMWTPDGNSLGDSIITQNGSVVTVGGTLKITGGTPGVSKYLGSDADGDASWNTINITEVTNGLGVSLGVADYIPRFSTSSVVTQGQIRDNGTNLAIGGSINNNVRFYVNSNSLSYTTFSENNLNGGVSLEGLSSGNGAGANYAIRGTAEDSTTLNVGSYGQAIKATVGKNVGIYGLATNTSGPAYGARFTDGTEAAGRVWTCVTSDGEGNWKDFIYDIDIPVGDKTTPITTGTNKAVIRVKRPVYIKAVRATLINAQATGSTFTVDILVGGISIFSTLLTIDNNEDTSFTALVPAVISNTGLISDDAKVSVSVTQVGDGTATGLDITLLCTTTL